MQNSNNLVDWKYFFYKITLIRNIFMRVLLTVLHIFYRFEVRVYFMKNQSQGGVYGTLFDEDI